MKLAIIGSRTITLNAIEIKSYIPDEIYAKIDTIVSGGAKGIDTCAEKFADYYKFKFIKLLPNWNEYGKRAGFIRNGKIVNHSDLIIAFWDGKSKGTIDTFVKAKKANKLLDIIIIKGKDK